MDWQKNDDDRVEGSARQGVELGVEETETGRKVVEGEGERGRERATHLDVGTAKVGFLRPWPVVRKFVRLAVILLGDRVHHQLSRGASVGGGVHVLWSRPSVRGEASVSRKKSYSQTHTHTHTHPARSHSFFLSLTAGSSTSISSLSHTRVHPVPAGIRFPEFFFHISHFFFLGGHYNCENWKN